MRWTVESSTSSRSSDAGRVWATRWSENNSELASASMADTVWRKCCWRALSSAGTVGEATGEGDHAEQAGPEGGVLQSLADPVVDDVLAVMVAIAAGGQLGAEQPPGGEPGEHARGDEAQGER